MAANAGTSALGGAATGATVGAAGGPVGIAIGAGVGALAGLIGYLIESGHEEEANKILRRAREAYGSLDDSAVEAAAREVLGPTNLSKIKADPRYRAMQDEALGQLSQLSRSGLSMSDRANLADSMDAAGQEDKHGREAILSSFNQRGMGGSDAELAAALSAQQGGANRASANARRIAGDAQDRSYSALRDMASLAGNLENTDYNRQADAARAQDSIDRFNNTAKYSRAADSYNRQRDMLDRQYDMAADQAGQERADGRRAGEVVAGVGNAAGKAIERGSAASGGGKPAPTTPAAGPAPARAPSTEVPGYETIDVEQGYGQPKDDDY